MTLTPIVERLTKALGSLMCALNFHPRLNVIQSFGQAQHIGCPRCGRQYAIHHGLRTVIPWDSELDELYNFMGYDTSAATEKWQQRTALQSQEANHE